MDIIDSYLTYVRVVRRYSDRTVSIYDGVLSDYLAYVSRQTPISSDEQFAQTFNVSELRSYVAHMLDEKNPKSARTVNLHLSALSGFCRYLMQQGLLKSNPVNLVTKPKTEKRIPQFYRKDAMEEYFSLSQHSLEDTYDGFIKECHTKSGRKAYSRIIERVIVSTLYSLGLRRSELIGMCISDVDFGRNVVKVRGKGDKMRENGIAGIDADPYRFFYHMNKGRLYHCDGSLCAAVLFQDFPFPKTKYPQKIHNIHSFFLV